MVDEKTQQLLEFYIWQGVFFDVTHEEALLDRPLAEGRMFYAPLEWRRLVNLPVVALIRNFPEKDLKSAVSSWCGLSLEKYKPREYNSAYMNLLGWYKNRAYILHEDNLLRIQDDELYCRGVSFFTKYLDHPDGSKKNFHLVYLQFREPIASETVRTDIPFDERPFLSLNIRRCNLDTWKRNLNPDWGDQEFLFIRHLLLGRVSDGANPLFKKQSKSSVQYITEAVKNSKDSMKKIYSDWRTCDFTLDPAVQTEEMDFLRVYLFQFLVNVPRTLLFYTAVVECIDTKEQLPKVERECYEFCLENRGLMVEIKKRQLQQTWARFDNGKKLYFDSLLEYPFTEEVFTWKAFDNKWDQLNACFTTMMFLSPFQLIAFQKGANKKNDFFKLIKIFHSKKVIRKMRQQRLQSSYDNSLYFFNDMLDSIPSSVSKPPLLLEYRLRPEKMCGVVLVEGDKGYDLLLCNQMHRTPTQELRYASLSKIGNNLPVKRVLTFYYDLVTSPLLSFNVEFDITAVDIKNS